MEFCIQAMDNRYLRFLKFETFQCFIQMQRIAGEKRVLV